MATTQIFAYNTGPSIAGTTQSGDFAIGTPISGFTNTPQFWNGPDEDLGYIIAQPVPSGNQPNPVGGPAYLGFFRTDGFSDLAFTEMASTVAGISFVNSSDAYNWLDANGYYTTFNPTTPTPTPTPTLTQTPTNTQTPTPTNTQTPTPSITASLTQTPTITPTKTQTPTPSVTASPTQTPSQTATQTTTPTVTQTPTITPSNTPNAQGFSYANFSSTSGLVLRGNASVSSNILYLTTAANNQVGNVYRTSAIQYNRNFSAQWQFTIGGGTGADGYCVQWTSTNNSTGTGGGGVGLIENVNTINALAFKTYPTVQNLIWYKNNVSQGTQSGPFTWRQTVYYWLDYNHAASTASLYISTTSTKPGSPSFTYNSFTFDTGSYYMGFGAATGGSNDNHQLFNWTLTFN